MGESSSSSTRRWKLTWGPAGDVTRPQTRRPVGPTLTDMTYGLRMHSDVTRPQTRRPVGPTLTDVTSEL